MIDRTLATSAIVALLCAPLFAQFAATPATSAPTFQAADVHVSPPRLHPDIPGNSRGDRVIFRDATLADLISLSYNVDASDVFGGPAWLAFDRFDINAKAASAVSSDAGRVMLRALLADRFKLVVHTDTRPLPAFALTVGKANKMKKAQDTTDTSGCQYQQPPANSAPRPAGTPEPPIRFSCHNTTMESFAEFLHDVASPYLPRPVVDQTGLKGGWDFDFQWNYQKSNDGSGISIFDAVDKQLGLKLESKPAPAPVVVVDSVNEKPTPNIPDLDKILPPPPPAEFEVAVIRPANPDEKNFNIEVQGNHVNVRYATLQTLIYKSYNVQPGLIENKPKWLNDVHWDIMGTASTGDASPIPGAVRDLEVEDVNEMLRSLLADRFKLVTHQGSRATTVYALVADNPKLKKADPANHPSCIEGPLPGAKDPRLDNPLLARLISCQNMTMAQFAVELHTLASGYVPGSVIDSTGLDGAYDFSVNFSRGDTLKTAAAAPTSAGSDAATLATDPGVGAISLFDALQKQLGVKLLKKDSVPVPTLVIDHVEDHPTDN